jgi:Spy/CpxP family protein refolding chaperone
MRDRDGRQESGSFIGRTPGSKIRDRKPDGPRGNGDRRPGNSPAPPAGREYTESGGPSPEAQTANASLIVFALLVLMIGAGGGYYLFRGGAAFTPNRELWTKQVELCCEMIQQMDAIITEAQAQDWDRCRDSMEALRELSGRRTILLANDINRAAIVFLAAATHCVQREEFTSHFEDMRLSFHTAINEMRKIVNSEPMTDDVHRLLDASHQQMQVIRRKESGAA